MKISACDETQIAKEISNPLRRTSFLCHLTLTLFFILTTGWCNTSLAVNKPWCASNGGDLNCVPFEYGPWVYSAYYSPYFGADGYFSSPTDAYNGLANITASRMGGANCTYEFGALSGFTLYSSQLQFATVNLSYGGPNCGYGASPSLIGYIQGFREKRGCPLGSSDYIYFCVVTTSYKIEIQGANNTEPSTSLPFKAIVTDQNNQPADAQVSLSVDVVAYTGGHEHDAGRPKGKLSATSGATGADGVLEFDFIATEVAGRHVITASCDKCSNNPQTAEVEVKVAGLDQIPGSPFYTLQLPN